MITILQTPDLFQPVYSPMDFVVSSDKTAQDNFKYILDLYVNGAASYTVRIAKSADNSTGRGHFDVHNILQNYVSSSISKSDDGFEKVSGGNVYYIAKFGEQFGSSTSGVTNYTNQAVDSTRHAWQGYVEPLPYTVYDQSDYIAASLSDFRFLTDIPNPVTVRSDEYRWVYMINSVTNGITSISIKTYDSAGALIQTVTVTNNFASIGTGQEDRHYLRFPAGVNMNNINSADITAGSLPVITASVKSYTLQVNSSLSLVTSGVTTYKVNDDCSKYTKYTLHFRNQLGGFETHSFILVSRFKAKSKKDKYKKIIGTLSSSAFTYAATDRADNVYNVSIDDQVTLQSTYMTDTEQRWLEQLITSPEVYHDDDTYGLVPITILDADFERGKRENDKLQALNLTFEYATKRYRK